MQKISNCSKGDETALIREIETHEIISFDIFDTLVMRKVYYNKDIFRLMAAGKQKPLCSLFYDARVKAQEKLTRKDYPYIEKIYEEAAKNCNGISERVNELIREEIELEKRMIIPREKTVSLYRLALQKGKTVNIVSDMYFHEETIREILYNAGIKEYHSLYISSEYNTGKAQHLFEHYLEKYPKEKCLHIGDSTECDILPAQKLGIDTFKLKMSSEIYEEAENKVPPEDLFERVKIAEYIAEKYNSPFESN